MCVHNTPPCHSLQEFIQQLVLQPREVTVQLDLDLSSFEPHQLREKLLEYRERRDQMRRQGTLPNTMELMQVEILEAILQQIVQQL